jgi:hypothetical protein
LEQVAQTALALTLFLALSLLLVVVAVVMVVVVLASQLYRVVLAVVVAHRFHLD